MSSERITITLSPRLARVVRERAKATGQPVSRIVAADLEAQEAQRLREKLIADYKAAARDPETQRVTAELQAPGDEDWPE